MSPEEWWDRIVDCMNGGIDHAGCGDPTDHLAAALAERDAQWRDAWAACGHFQEMTACPDSCPLRDLLDAAARSANKAVSAAADPE